MGETKRKISQFEFLNQFLMLCVLTTALGILVSGCGQPGSINSQSKKAEPAPVAPPEQMQEQPQKSVHIKTINVNEIKSTDVLIVIDNSASMRFEQANMAARFSSLIDEMKGLDWRLGIITTDMSGTGAKKDGNLLEFSGSSGIFFLDSTMPKDKVETLFSATIQRPSREGNANEQGIKATFRALEKNQSKWIRQDGALNVVVVSDADETPFKGKFEVRNSPNSLVQYVKSKYPAKTFSFHSIVVKEGDTACRKNEDNEAYGLLYTKLSKTTGGVVGSVCEQDYAKQLSLIGETAAQVVKNVKLDCAPVPDSIRVENKTGDSFTVTGDVIHFAKPLPVGTTQIHYQCLMN